MSKFSDITSLWPTFYIKGGNWPLVCSYWWANCTNWTWTFCLSWSGTTVTKSLVGGPVWILQLWLNALFNNYLVYSPPEDLDIVTYGSILCYLRYKARRGMDDEKNFLQFFELFHGLTVLTRQRSISPFLLRGKLALIGLLGQLIWQCRGLSHFLCRILLLNCCIAWKTDSHAYVCLQNTVARQLRFCQAIPTLLN